METLIVLHLHSPNRAASIHRWFRFRTRQHMTIILPILVVVKYQATYSCEAQLISQWPKSNALRHILSPSLFFALQKTDMAIIWGPAVDRWCYAEELCPTCAGRLDVYNHHQWKKINWDLFLSICDFFFTYRGIKNGGMNIWYTLLLMPF